MQIIFDTANPKDANILQLLLKYVNLLQGSEYASAEHTKQAQPGVADNPGSTASAVNPSSVEGSGVSEPVAEQAPAPVEKKERKPRAKKEEAVAAEPQNEVAESAEPVAETVAESATTDAKPLTIDDVRSALQQFTAGKGVPAGIELLKEFKAARISELAEEQYADFVKACAV